MSASKSAKQRLDPTHLGVDAGVLAVDKYVEELRQLIIDSDSDRIDLEPNGHASVTKTRWLTADSPLPSTST